MIDYIHTVLSQLVLSLLSPTVSTCLERRMLLFETTLEMSLGYSKVFSSAGHSVMSNSLQTHGLHNARLPCISPTPRACSNSCPLSQWCHPTISSSVVPISSYLQSFPKSGSFPLSQFFTSDSQSIWSFSFNISPSNEYSGLISVRMDWLDLNAVQGTLKSSPTPQDQKHQFFWVQLSL